MNKFLPIGSVVLLKDATKKVLITGYCAKAEDEDVVYDYNGCIFPEGFMDNVFILFNESDIQEVFHKGLENDESKEYIEKISSLLTDKNSISYKNDDEEKYSVSSSTNTSSNHVSNPLSKEEMTSRYTIRKVSGSNDIQSSDY